MKSNLARNIQGESDVCGNVCPGVVGDIPNMARRGGKYADVVCRLFVQLLPLDWEVVVRTRNYHLTSFLPHGR